MTGTSRLVLGVLGGVAVVGGLGYALVEMGYLPNPFAAAAPSGLAQIVAWPQTFYQAKKALVQLSVIAIEHQNTTLEQQAHAEAEAIRAVYPGAGPTGGYTCQQLVQMGEIDASYCTAGS